MIDQLEGTIWSLSPTFVTLNVNGVGYGLHVTIPTGSMCSLGQKKHFYTHLSIREDAWDMYGFLNTSDREVFRTLIGVTGIGSKTAQRMLSECPAEKLLQYISEGNTTALTKIKGIGIKTAEIMVVQLKGTAQKLNLNPLNQTSLHPHDQEALLALITLGLKETIAQKALEKAKKELDSDCELATLITTALRFT
jgi:holliday junction DNA helicase RuvA